METPPRSSTIIRPPTPLAFDSLIDTSRFSSSSPPSSPTHLGSLARAQISSPWRPSIPIASLIHPSTEETMSVESPLLLFDSDKENVLMHSLDSHASIPSSPLFPGPECKQAQNERDTIKFPATDAHVSEVPLRDLMNLSTPGLRLTRSRTKLSDKHGNAECLASTSTGPVKIKVPIALSVPKELPRKMDVPRKVRGSTMSRDPRIPPRMRLPPELTEQQSVDRTLEDYKKTIMAELQKTKRFLNKIKDPEDRRKERNRLSAKRARDKKSQLIVSLMQENAELKRRVAALESGKSVQEATDPSCFGYV